MWSFRPWGAVAYILSIEAEEEEVGEEGEEEADDDDDHDIPADPVI